MFVFHFIVYGFKKQTTKVLEARVFHAFHSIKKYTYVIVCLDLTTEIKRWVENKKSFAIQNVYNFE